MDLNVYIVVGFVVFDVVNTTLSVFQFKDIRCGVKQNGNEYSEFYSTTKLYCVQFCIKDTRCHSFLYQVIFFDKEMRITTQYFRKYFNVL